MAGGYSHVVWDFNGTLLDDLDVAIAAVSDMLARRNMPAMTRQRYYESMEMPIIRYYEKIFDLKQDPFEVLSREFVEGYEKHFSLARLADGAGEAVAHFARLGARQVIISSFEQGRLRAMARELGIAGCFDGILGADNIRSESKVERATRWLEDSGAAGGSILVVGDLVHDWEMARALGADCVLLDCGHQAREDLLRCGCPVIHSLRQLVGPGAPFKGENSEDTGK